MQPPKPLTLRRNFSWTFAGNLVYAASQWGMLVLLAKLGSPETVGQFSLGLAVTAPVFMLTNLQLRSLQATDAKKEYLFGDYLGLRLIGTTLALFIAISLSYLSGYSGEILWTIVAIAISKAFESISDIFYGLIQNHERMDRISISLMIKGPLSLLALGAGVYLTGSIVGGSVALAVAWALVLVSYDIPNSLLLLQTQTAKEIEVLNSREEDSLSQGSPSAKHPEGVHLPKWYPRWHRQTLVKLLLLSLPLGVVMMLISLNINIPRYFIEHYLSTHELGIFSALSYLMVAGQMVISSLSQSASPRLAKYYAAGNSLAFRTLLLKLIGIAMVLGGVAVVIALIAGQPILTLLYSPEYAREINVFVWLMVAAGVNYISYFLGAGMTAARYLRVQIPMFLLLTGVSALACFWLIPAYGLLGAAWALLIGAIIQVAFCLGTIGHALYNLERYQSAA